jgi:hypothetical protein
MMISGSKMYKLNKINTDPIDDDESEFGDYAHSSALNSKADDDSTISMQ